MQRKENIGSRYGRKEEQKNISSRTKVRNVITCILLSVVLGVCGCTKKEQLVLSVQNDTAVNMEENREDIGDARADLAEKDGLRQSIYVHVCGAVVNPGVYELPTGSRVYEAVQAAGGFTEEADVNYVNQALALTDAVQLVIPTVEEAEAWQTQDGQADDGKININTASESQLCDIPGIGAVRAAAIAAYRQEHGAFETIEDIMKVSGIKQGTYDKIKDSIKVN
ncbi:MAG: helix-hairpin-helix domain-containing protein [Lachnospiraceae bacterium]